MGKSIKKTSVVFLVKENGKYLFQKRKDVNSYGEFYVLPGGHVEEGESVKSAAIRELFEELDIVVNGTDLEFKLVQSSKNYITFFFEVKKYKGQIKNKEKDKHEDVCFLSLEDEKIYPLTLKEICEANAGHIFMDLDELKLRRSARAILISKNKKLVLIKRTKKGISPYYVTPGGGIEEGEDSITALVREVKEEVGGIVEKANFIFHFDDYVKGNSVDFFVCHELNREAPIGNEWSQYNSLENQYEVVEVSLNEVKDLNLKPVELKNKIIDAYKGEIA